MNGKVIVPVFVPTVDHTADAPPTVVAKACQHDLAKLDAAIAALTALRAELVTTRATGGAISS
jgi:hypothetical protein